MKAQGGRCWYCELPMWETDPEAFARQHGLTIGQTRLRRCTAEHLVARRDGGTDTSDNVVAACIWCNRQRHRRKRAPNPDGWKARVRAAVASGRWRHFWPKGSWQAASPSARGAALTAS